MDMPSADQWFAALDQRQIVSDAESWTAQVLSVYTEAEGLWIQIAPTDDPCTTVVLHVSPATPIDDVIEALAHRSHAIDKPSPVIELLA